MPSDLNDRLRALHTELAATPAVDTEARQALVSLLGDITRLLEQPGETEGDEPITDRLEAVALRFEADHPSLGGAIRGVVDALAKAGI